jgi:hypothetical protein
MSVGYLVASLVGAYYWGAMGAVVGAAVAIVPGALLWWWQLHAGMRESGILSDGNGPAQYDQQPTMAPVQHMAASVPTSSQVVTPAVNQTNGHGELSVRPWGKTEPVSSDWSAESRSPVSSIPPTTRVPSFAATTWTVVVSSDRTYYDRMQVVRALSGSTLAFPGYPHERRFSLASKEMRVGRRSAASGLEPDIDLSGPPADPGVSRLHAVLIPAPDGTWAVLDPGSANGTLLNGRKIAVGDLIPLRDGDRINLGAWTVITVHHR